MSCICKFIHYAQNYSYMTSHFVKLIGRSRVGQRQCLKKSPKNRTRERLIWFRRIQAFILNLSVCVIFILIAVRLNKNRMRTKFEFHFASLPKQSASAPFPLSVPTALNCFCILWTVVISDGKYVRIKNEQQKCWGEHISGLKCLSW